MLWMRFSLDGRIGFGSLDDGQIHVHEGDLFDSPKPTGRMVAAADVQWLTATDVCTFIGIDRPTKSDATRAGSILRELNRVTSRKSNGIHLLAVPTKLGGAA